MLVTLLLGPTLNLYCADYVELAGYPLRGNHQCVICMKYRIIVLIIITRCSMPETRQTALLHVACGNAAIWRYCMDAKFTCISSSHAYSTKWPYVKTMNAKKYEKKHRFMRMRTHS